MRLIDADKLDEEAMYLFIAIAGNPKQHTVVNECKSSFRRMIEEQPTVEAKEVVHGYVKTVVGEMGVMHQECSACGNVLEWKAYPNYCDECGAKLDGADMRTSAE